MFGLRRIFTMESGSAIKNQALALIFGLMEDPTKDIGKMIKDVDKELLFGSQWVSFIFKHCVITLGYKYTGEWLNDRGDGFGKFYWENGDCYQGNWKNGKRVGKGRLITSDGKIYSQSWNEQSEFNASNRGNKDAEIIEQTSEEECGRNGKRMRLEIM
jgi:hypothetical protein